MSVSLLKRAGSLAVAQVGCEGLGLVRNLILARALGPSEMGVAATLAVTMSFFEAASDLGVDRLLVQAEDGDSRKFQATAQGMQVARGLMIGLLFVLIGFPWATLLGQPQLGWAMMALGIVPVIRGWLHLDYKLAQRERDFRPLLATELLATLLTTLAAIPVTRWTGSATSVVWLSVLQSSLLVVTSHLVARRRFEMTVDADLARRIFRFGWPLMCNGVLLFGALQGDRLVLALVASKEDLGRYSVAFQLTMIPALLFARLATTYWLPALSRVQADAVAFRQLYGHITRILTIIAVVSVGGFLLLGNEVIGMLYGSRFQVSSALVFWLAASQGIRVLRTAPCLAALAHADGYTPLAGNVLRLSGIAGAAFVGWNGWGLELMAAAGCGGELIAYVGSLVLLQRRHGTLRSSTRREELGLPRVSMAGTSS